MTLNELLRLTPVEAVAKGGVKIDNPNPGLRRAEDDRAVVESSEKAARRLLKRRGLELDRVVSDYSHWGWGDWRLERDLERELSDQQDPSERRILLELLALCPRYRKRSYRGVTVRSADVILTIKNGRKEQCFAFPRSMISGLPA